MYMYVLESFACLQGNVGKIFLEWEKPFWREGDGGIKFCWSDEERQEAHPEKHW